MIIFIRFYILFVIFIGFDCSAQDQSNGFLPIKMMVQDVVYLKDTTYAKNDCIKYPIVQIYENRTKNDVLYYLIDHALDGELTPLEPVIDDFFPYSVYKNAKPKAIKRYEVVQQLKDDNFHEVHYEIDYHEDAVGLSFIENWHFDIENQTFEKEVLGYEIIRKTFNPDNLMEVYDIPFRILYPEGLNESGGNYILACHVAYEFLLAPVSYYNHIPVEENMPENETNGFFDIPVKNYCGKNYRHVPLMVGYSKKRFIRDIITKVLNQKVTAFDYKTGSRLTKTELEKRLYLIDTVSIIKPGLQKANTILKIRHPLHEFNSLIFIEDWYINTSNGHLRKKVKQLAMVRGYLKYDDQYYETNDRKHVKWKKKIVFLIKLQ